MPDLKIKRKDIYEVRFWACECPNCHEQIEVDSTMVDSWFCELCDTKFDVVDSEV